MKIVKYSSFLFLTLLFALNACTSKTAVSKVVEQEIRVFGNCDQCKERIETALVRPGVKTAEWDKQSKMLTVVYRSDKVSEVQIHEWIAEAGHDTKKTKAENAKYETLPGCCKYRDGENTH